jgi:nitrogen regulatory protein P-II 1
MKLIKAFIRHRKTEEVFNALVAAGFCCMTFVECEGTGRTQTTKKNMSAPNTLLLRLIV